MTSLHSALSRHTIAVVVFVAACLAPASLVGAPKSVRLVAGERATLHVGELAVVRLAFDRPERPFVSGAWADALVVARQSRREVVFKAIRSGKAVILFAPKRQEGECISCITEHYFVDVVEP